MRMVPVKAGRLVDGDLKRELEVFPRVYYRLENLILMTGGRHMSSVIVKASAGGGKYQRTAVVWGREQFIRRGGWEFIMQSKLEKVAFFQADSGRLMDIIVHHMAVV